MNKRASILLVFLALFSSASFSKPMPSFQVIDFETGETKTNADFEGKVIYLDFWASWCKPCKQTFPFMNELKAKYPEQQFEVIAINMDEFDEDAKAFLEKVPANFAIYKNPENKLAGEMDIPGLPVAFIIDKTGAVAARHIGFNERKKQKKIKQIDYLLGQK